MNPSNTPQSSPETALPPATPQKSKWKLPLAIVVVGVLLVGAYGSGYKVASHSVPMSTTAGVAPAQAKSSSTSPRTVHFISSLGYPLGSKNKYNFSLGIPANIQAVLVSSRVQDGAAAQYLSTTYNGEMGRWVLGDENSLASTNSEVSIVAIENDWLNGAAPLAAQPADQSAEFYTDAANNLNFLRGHNIQTAAQRKQYLADLVRDTNSCASDSAKGFATADFKVCYKVTSGHDGYEPVLSMQGYAESGGSKFVLSGLIFIHDTSVNTDDETADRQAMSDFSAGKYTSNLKQQIADYLAAIKQTKLVVSPR